MKLRILWPGKTRNRHLNEIQREYLEKIRKMEACELIETKEGRGIDEKHVCRIKEIEADGLEKHLKDDYIICLLDGGKQMSSERFARFLDEVSSEGWRSVTFIVGGFLGLAERIVERAHLLLSLSKMTFSHELTRVVLLEQIYRSLMIRRRKPYAK